MSDDTAMDALDAMLVTDELTGETVTYAEACRRMFAAVLEDRFGPGEAGRRAAVEDMRRFADSYRKEMVR